MIDMDACRTNAWDLYLSQSGDLELDAFIEKFRDQFDSAGRWFVSNGLGKWSDEHPLGWLPHPILEKITRQLQTKQKLSWTLARKFSKTLAKPEAAQHFTTLLGLVLFIGLTGLIVEYLDSIGNPELGPHSSSDLIGSLH